MNFKASALSLGRDRDALFLKLIIRRNTYHGDKNSKEEWCGGTRINSSALTYGLLIHTSSVCYGYVRNQRAYSF